MKYFISAMIVLAMFALSGAQIVVNEIMFNPPGTSEEEWIELFNYSDTDIYLDSNWCIADGEGEFFFSEDTIYSHGYLTILFNIPSDSSEIHIVPDIDATGISTGIRLANTEDDVIILNIQGDDTLIIDSVTYHGNWADSANNTGKTLERIHTFENSNDPENWGASEILWGTPGAPNSICGIEEKASIPARFEIAAEPNPFNSACVISSNSAYPVSANIFTLTGQAVKNWQIPAGENKIIWSADDMPSGIYIFSAVSDNENISLPIILIK